MLYHYLCEIRDSVQTNRMKLNSVQKAVAEYENLFETTVHGLLPCSNRSQTLPVFSVNIAS